MFDPHNSNTVEFLYNPKKNLTLSDISKFSLEERKKIIFNIPYHFKEAQPILSVFAIINPIASNKQNFINPITSINQNIYICICIVIRSFYLLQKKVANNDILKRFSQLYQVTTASIIKEMFIVLS